MGGLFFDHVTPEMRIYKEEIFGPVLTCVRVKGFAEAAEHVNNHEFGNSVCGPDISDRFKVGALS